MVFIMLLLASLAGGVLCVLLAATLLAFRSRRLGLLLPRLISFSTGTLLGTALLGMIPHAAARLEMADVSLLLLAGLALFFFLEKILIWRHCHRKDCDFHAGSGPLLLIGDSVHNLIDGVVLASAFMASPTLGIAAAVSTIAHEVPQELGEFVVYLHAGYSRKRALLLNVLSSLTSVVGALLGWFFLSAAREAGPYLLAIAAAGFLYVALADLVPSQRGKSSLAATLLDLLLTVLGVAVTWLATRGHSG